MLVTHRREDNASVLVCDPCGAALVSTEMQAPRVEPSRFRLWAKELRGWMHNGGSVDLCNKCSRKYRKKR